MDFYIIGNPGVKVFLKGLEKSLKRIGKQDETSENEPSQNFGNPEEKSRPGIP